MVFKAFSPLLPHQASMLRFLSGGGEMGTLMRAHDWSSTPLGLPQNWSQSLRAVVRLVLTSSHPMAVFWGSEHIFFYNDAFRASLGSELHPSLLGAHGRSGWKDIWELIEPQISVVMSGEGATWHDDQLIPITRHGRLEEVYWTYGYSPVHEESAPNQVGGALVVCTETTAKVLGNKNADFQLRLEEKLRDLNDVQSVKAAACEAVGRELLASFVAYTEIDKAEDYVTSEDKWIASGFLAIAGAYRLDDLGDAIIAELRAGRIVKVDDTSVHLFTAHKPQEAVYKALGTRSLVCVPLLKGGQLVAALSVLYAKPRVWAEHELGMVREVIGRIWSAVARAQSVADLVESETRFQAIANSIDHMVWSSRPDGYHDYFNQRWYEYTGVLQGTTDGEAWRNMFHPDDHARTATAWQNSLTTGAPYYIEYRLRHHSGQYRWVIGRAQPVYGQRGQISRWYGTCTDIHEIMEARNVLARSREELEQIVTDRTADLILAAELLRQSQKMEAIGQLTGGIAHDFNNMLAVVMGALSLVRRGLGPHDPTLRHVDAASDSARRSAMLVKRLLAFSRQQSLAPETVNTNTLVEGMSDLLSHTLGSHICVVNQLANDLWLTHVDPNQLENVILNLAVNARDAMPGGGVLTVVTHNADFGMPEKAQTLGMVPGDYVMLSVRDTGVGIPPEALSKVFDPFFTTKAVGKGTGLGLSQVYGFLKQSGGYVNIRSNPGAGTSVEIYLPRLFTDAPHTILPVAASTARNAHKKVVLVVDDLAHVRRFVLDALADLGYVTMEADGGLEALRCIDAYPEISLVLTDIVMIDMDGRVLAEEICRRRPQLKILFMTGYAPQTVTQTESVAGGIKRITKPFTVEELARAVAQIFDAPTLTTATDSSTAEYERKPA